MIFFYKRIISVLTLHRECYKVSETLTDLGVDGGDISVRSHHPHYADTEDINPGGTQNISQKYYVVIISSIKVDMAFFYFDKSKSYKTN